MFQAPGMECAKPLRLCSERENQALLWTSEQQSRRLTPRICEGGWAGQAAPGKPEQRGHPRVSVGRPLHASLGSLDFIHLTARSQGRLLAGEKHNRRHALALLGPVSSLPHLQILPPLWSFIYPNVPSPPTWGHCPWRGGCPLPPECPIALCRLCTVHPPLNLAEHVHSMLRVSLCDVGVKPSNATTTRVDLHRWGQISLDGPSHVSV